MRALSLIKLPGGQQYEARHFEAEFSDSDLPPALLEELTPNERWRVLNYLAQKATITFEITQAWNNAALIPELKQKMDMLKTILLRVVPKAGAAGRDLIEIMEKYGL
jgi:hypothetical protein